MSTFHPEPSGLKQLTEILKDSLSGQDRTKQKQAELMLVQARQNADYINYLTYIFSQAELRQTLDLSAATDFLIRYAAAVNLKNYIKLNYKQISPPQISYVKARTLQALQDHNPQLRSFSGTIITELIQQGGLLQWPEVLQELMSLVSNSSGNMPAETQEAAMMALAKVCDDNKKLLDKTYEGQRPMTVIVPKLLEYSSNDNPKIRYHALSTLKAFIPQKSQTLYANLDAYMQKIFQLATDTDVQVRQVVCQSLVALVEQRPDMLVPHLEGLVHYILAQQQSPDDPELALDAAEFWLSVGEQTQLRDLMGPYLQRVIPVLLAGMVYGEDDVARLTGDEDDADQEDNVEDVKPRFAQTKAGRGISKQDQADINGSQSGDGPMKQELSDGEIEESEDEDEWDDDDPENAWSLRKCSAAALDVFAVNYHGAVFDIILPYLKDNLSHNLWPRREAAILALGAIAEGCIEVVSPHLPELVPFLIAGLSDEEPVVRQITCWCLARYSEWAANLSNPVDVQRFFEPMMEGLLQRMLDRNKKVQEAGASSFASLEEKAGNKLKPYIGPILRQFVQCFQRYKDKNMYVLYDCLQTLADNVGSDMATPELIDLLMPTLIERWNKIADDSREVFPLLGCLGYVAIAYGDAFAQFAPPIFERCTKLIFENLQQYMAYMSSQSVDSPDKDFVVTALDLLSAIIQAIDPAKSARLIQSQPQFFDLLSFCMEDPTDDVRQSAFALLGDCAVAFFDQLEPQLGKLVPVLARRLDLDLIKDEDSFTAFNALTNTCWAAGEIAVHAGTKMSPFAEALYQGLFTIVQHEDCPDTVNENAATALGRLGLAVPDELAGHLPEFAESFLSTMGLVQTTSEKASAFLGFNNVIQRNPQGMEKALKDYFIAIATFPGKSAEYAEIRESFGRVMQGYQQLIPDFASFFASLPEKVRSKLKSAYPL